MYYRRPRRKRAKNYFMPFVVIVLIFLGIFYGWKSITNNWVSQNQNTFNEKVLLNIEYGSAKAMTVGKQEWQNAPDIIDLYRGEKIKTDSDGRVTLSYFDDSELRLDTNTEISLETLKRRGEINTIETALKSGQVWAEVNHDGQSKSAFIVTTELFDVSAKNSTFSISTPNNVYVLDGIVQVSLKKDGEVIKEYNVGVGQQLSAGLSSIEALEKGESTEVLFALDSNFKSTNWYSWNQEKNGKKVIAQNSEDTNEETNTNEEEEGQTESTNEESSLSDNTETQEESDNETLDEKPETEEVEFSITRPKDGDATNKSSITFNGTYNDSIDNITINGKEANMSQQKWSISAQLNESGQTKFTVKAFDVLGKEIESEVINITYDTDKPEKPVVTSPKSDNQSEEITIEANEQEITGTVNKDVAVVIVNDYRLTQYQAGSGEFKYFAKTTFGNLEVGENTYEIIAEDAAGNQSEPTTITLILTEEAAEETNAESTDNSTNNNPATTNTQSFGVVITEPNNGEDFHTIETQFEIKGTVPENTTKVTVNDYELSQFSEGDSEFIYRAYASMGSLSIGKKNTYTVKAYDQNSEVIGTDTITIDVESGESAAPVITIPSSEANYTTSLDTVVIGGSVGKWVTRIYINDQEIKEYIPGSEEFKKSYQLKAGENKITIKAEKAGEPSGEDTITINYTP